MRCFSPVTRKVMLMKYQETGFRALYHNFAAFKISENIRNAISDFPNASEANCVLVYGYIDHEAGLTLEIMAAGIEKNKRYKFFEPSVGMRSFIRIGAIEQEEFVLFNDKDGSFGSRFAEQIDILKHYDVDEEIEKSRKMGFLDGCRHPHYPDDVMVYLVRKDRQTDGCWARISGLGEHYIIATLLNEPNQDFGYHIGEKIAFFVQETEEKEIICYSDMNPSQILTSEDLEDGTMLREAISVFNAERTEKNLLDVLELLRDSYVWVPCNAIMSEADQKAVEEMINGAEGNLESLIGLEMSNQDNIRFVPDILQNGDGFFFPAFITEDDMGEYGSHFSKIQKHFLEVIALAKNNEKEIRGIVINAFTDPWVLDREIFDIVEKMKTRIIDGEGQ